MASKTEQNQSQRFIKFINQQLEILKEERDTVKMASDDCINQVQNEVDSWVSGGQVSKETCSEISSRIQQAITFLIEKSEEISDLKTNKSDNAQNQNSLSNTIDSTSHSLRVKLDAEKSDMMLTSKVVPNKANEKTSKGTEEAVFSLKKTAEEVQEKQENVDRILKDVSTKQVNIDNILKDVLTQQGNFNKKVENYNQTNSNLNKQTQKTIQEFVKKSHASSSRIDQFNENLTNVHARLNRLEEEYKCVNVSINELNKEISSVRTCSNDSNMPINDLSKRVESTNQHYNEMSNKMNQLEISINLMSSQYTEQFENMGSLFKNKTDDLIGVVCQIIAKRLNPIENLKEALNKISTTKTPLSLKMESMQCQFVDLSNKIVHIESKFRQPNVGFYAFCYFDLNVGKYNLENFTIVFGNYGNHFDSVSGEFTAPFNGLYLISISSKDSENNSIEIGSYEKYSSPPSKERKKFLGSCFGSHSLTFCAELKEGEAIFLKAMIVKVYRSAVIDFSCCLINR